jgi:hypothetical protein
LQAKQKKTSQISFSKQKLPTKNLIIFFEFHHDSQLAILPSPASTLKKTNLLFSEIRQPTSITSRKIPKSI